MKQVNVTFEDANYTFLLGVKETHKGNWHDFILDMARHYKQKEKNK